MGNTFVRLRLTTDDLVETPDIQDSRSVGPASDGEVEDYIVAIESVTDLTALKSADRETIAFGEEITYFIEVINYGPGPATDTVLTDLVPPELFDPQYSIDGGATWAPWAGSLPLGTLDPGASVLVLIRGKFSGPEVDFLINTAEVTTSATDSDPSNNTSTVVTPVVSDADLEVTKWADPEPAVPGQYLTYTIDVINHGPSVARDIMLTDTISPFLLDPEYSIDGGATYYPWNSPYWIGELPPGAIVTILIRGIVEKSAIGFIENTVDVFSPTPDPNPDNNSYTIVTPIEDQADLSVVKLGSPDPVRSGELLNYTVVISNAGPSIARFTTLTDIVPQELIGVEFSTDGGATFQPWDGSYLLGDLPAGDTQIILIRGRVSASAIGTIYNTATVQSDTPDPDFGNNTSTVETKVDAIADLSVTKVGSPNPVMAGERLVYTIVVTNYGPSDAPDVVLQDTIPAELTDVEYSTDGGATFRPWTGSENLGTLENGTSVAVLIRGTVANTATGTISNTALVDSAAPDPDPNNNQDTETTPINTSADLSINKTGTPNPVVPGQYLLYTIVITNHGPNPALNPVLRDAIPAELENAQYSTDGGTTWTAWTGSYTGTTLENGETLTILIRGTVSVSAAGTITNTATVSSDTPDPNPDDNSDTEITAVNEAADVSVIKTLSPKPVAAGEMLTYTVTVFNAGPNAAQNVELADEVPLGILNPEFAVQGGTDFAPWVSPYRIGTLEPGAYFTVTIRGIIDASYRDGILSNTASVSSTTPDPDLTNNTSEANTPVDTLADVSVKKRSDASLVVPGQRIVYTVAVTNAGPSDAQGVLVVDALPASLLNPEFSTDGGVTYAPWSSPYLLGSLAAGEEKELQIRGTVSPSATGSLINTAVVESTTPDPAPDNNTSTDITPIQPSADVSIVKTGSPSPVYAGGRLTYTLLVSNAGPSEAENILVRDTLPAGLDNAEISADGGRTWAPFDGVYQLGNLAAGTEARLLLRADVSLSAEGELSNRATVASDTPDPNLENNSDVVEMPVVPVGADLSILKTASCKCVCPCQRLIYALTVTNYGPNRADRVVISDALPKELEKAVYTADGGATWSRWNGSYEVGTLAAGASITVYISGIVHACAKCSICNTAAVASSTPDPDVSNNTASVTVGIRGCCSCNKR